MLAIRSGRLFLAGALALAGPGHLLAATSSHDLLVAGALVDPAVVAVGERGTILRSTDRARTWTAIPSGVNTMLTAVSFAPDGSRGWAVGHEGVVLTTSDAGRTWQRQRVNAGRVDSFLDVLALDARHVLAVGAYGLFAETHDAGQTWEVRAISEQDTHFNRIARAADGTLYLAGEAGTLLKSADAGATWQPLSSPYTGSLYGVTPLDARTLVAYGLRGHIFRSADAGATWTELPVTSAGLVAAALPLHDGSLVLAGSGRPLAVSRNTARTVENLDVPLPGAIAALLELPDHSLLTLGEAGASLVRLPPAP